MRNQSMASLAKSCVTPLILSVGLLAAFSASAADPVYKWKDAQGHSHYSQSPPEGIKYETMAPSGTPVDTSGVAPAVAAQSASSAPKADGTAAPTPAQQQRQKLCENARSNATTLTSNATVVGDVNGDGKKVTLDAQQHDSALSDANKQVDLYCSK